MRSPKLRKILTINDISRKLDDIVDQVAFIIDLDDKTPQDWHKLEAIRADFDKYTQKLWDYLLQEKQEDN